MLLAARVCTTAEATNERKCNTRSEAAASAQSKPRSENRSSFTRSTNRTHLVPVDRQTNDIFSSVNRNASSLSFSKANQNDQFTSVATNTSDRFTIVKPRSTPSTPTRPEPAAELQAEAELVPAPKSHRRCRK